MGGNRCGRYRLSGPLRQELRVGGSAGPSIPDTCFSPGEGAVPGFIPYGGDAGNFPPTAGEISSSARPSLKMGGEEQRPLPRPAHLILKN